MWTLPLLVAPRSLLAWRVLGTASLGLASLGVASSLLAPPLLVILFGTDDALSAVM
jgi:hypothetical protein